MRLSKRHESESCFGLTTAMTAQVIPFNPLDKRNLGESVTQALLTAPAMPLDRLASFPGAGVYALYYTGGFSAYAKLAKRAKSAPGRDQAAIPIYVGKAVPAGARRGVRSGVIDNLPGKVLYKRLEEHAQSIDAAQNLDLADFQCRFLVVDDIWIPLGESLLIARFTPLWKTLIDGFGNHDPGSGRYAGVRPRWDVLHPGRAWATRLKEREETAEEIAMDAVTFLNAR